MRRSTPSLLTVLPAALAAGLVGASLPLTLGPTAQAAPTVPTVQTAGEPAFTGYSAVAWAAPVKVELYEPTVPIPATPQAELELAYTTTEAATGLHKGRASWLWPGDPVGEGFATFGETLGLPPELYRDGYPVQVNSQHPGGPADHRDEPFPGTMMRTTAAADQVSAVAGYSPDGRPSDDGRDGDGDAPALPGLPSPSEPPDAPSAPAAPSIADFGAAITGQQPTGGTAAAEDPDDSGAPGVPPELAALVDFTGYTSASSVVPAGGKVTSSSSSALAEVSLLAGVVTVEGLSARSRTTSDGRSSSASGGSKVGAVTIAGQAFSMGSDGLEAGGRDVAIPGLPDDPDKALAELGITITGPHRDLGSRGLAASGLSEALQVELDVARLEQHLDRVPVSEVIGAVPDQAQDLKDVLGALANLSPRVVLTLGTAATQTETIEGIELPALPAPSGGEAGAAPGATSGGGTAPGAGAGDAGGAAAGGAPAAGAPTDGAATDGELTDAAPMGAGLPPLTTIPGALTLGGIVAAVAAGTWLRRIGVLALGGAGSCSHGLDTGLPDLRKA